MTQLLATLLAVLASSASQPPQDPNPAPRALAANSTAAFGLDLYRALAAAAPDDNLFVSPWSLAAALAMTAEGASGETAAQILAALHVPPDRLAEAHAGFSALMQTFANGGGNVDDATRQRMASLREQLRQQNAESVEHEHASRWQEASASQQRATRTATLLNQLLRDADRYVLRTANALWVDRACQLEAPFVRTLAQHYGTGAAQLLDFKTATEPARRTINAWVAQNTEDHIPELLPQGLLTADTRLVLTNAVWFQGAWAVPFQKRDTTDEDFVLASGERVRSKRMRDRYREGLRYGAFHGDGRPFATPTSVPGTPGRAAAAAPATYPADDGFTMVELPYKGNELSMLVLLPRAHDGLPRLERMMTQEALAKWIASTKAFAVDVAIPRFTQRCRADVASPLHALGVQRAFADPTTTAGAQFDRMVKAGSREESLRIDAVVHEAWIAVGEEGTEAAAATAVAMAVMSAMPNVTMAPFRPVFWADHPFAFVIRDSKSGAVVFVGRVADPRG